MKQKAIGKNTVFKRMAAFATSLTILVSSVCFPEMGDGIKSVFNNITARAEVITVKNEKVESLKELYEFSNNYHNNPSAYSRTNLTIKFTDNEISSTKDFDGEVLTWYPIGTEEYPFDGRIVLNISGTSPQNIVTNEPLFAYITDSVEFANITTVDNKYVPHDIVLKRDTDSGKPLLAENVIHDADADSTPANWKIHIETDHTYGGLLGTVGENVNVNINLEVVSSADVVSDGNAGLVCQKMDAASTVNVNILPSCSDTSVDVTSTGGNAGAFAGEMMPGSVLNIFPGNYLVADASRKLSAQNYAGGLVGKNDQATVRLFDFVRDGNDAPVVDANGNYTYCVQVDTNGDPVTDANGNPVYVEQLYDALGTITSSNGAAGGVFGYFKVRTDDNRFSPAYYKSTSGCTLNGKTAGGLVGELVGNGLDLSYSGNSDSDRLSVVSTVSADGSHTTYGGIVGSYSNSDLAKTFTIEHTDVTISGGSATTYGGAIGTIDGSNPLYVKVDDFTLSATGSVGDCKYFGGVTGSAGDKGSMLDIGDITITTTNSFKGGGVVGQLSAGVLRLSGTTNLASTNIASGGQLVGERKNALVYALGNGADADGTSYEQGWRFVRSNADPGYDDIGTWGEVVRISAVETKDPAAGADTSGSILIYNSTSHTVTVGSPVQDMRSAADFTRTALNMQLNDGNKGALLFSGTGRSTLLENTNLTLFGTINLEGTGITGFMRDGSVSDDGNEIKAFTGKLSKGTPEDGEDDEEAVISLAVGERYGVYSGASNGRGAIYRHRFNGLFARTGDGATIEDITIGGYMNIRALADDMNIGGAAAYVKDAVTLTDVKASETINYAHLGTTKNHYVGGLIGVTNCAAGKTVKIQGSDSEDKVEIAPTINVTGTGVNNDTDTVVNQAVGGLIGYISSTAVASTDIKNITLSATVDASGAGAVNCVSVAGMIADIAFYSEFGTDTRTLNLENIDIIGTVVKSNAINSTGGILGYRWPGTDVNFDNVVLAADENNVNVINELNTTAKYVGGLVYKATGNWYVPSGGIDIESFAIKNGASAATPTSLGLLVHDGFVVSEGNTCGIFLEMTASDSYTLASGLTIPTMSSNYDELVFALAKDHESVLTNNTAGVISYATSDGAYTSAEGTKNSYNNVYNTTVVNNRSRYYYNADRESCATNSEDPGYQLLFWSLNRYAATNIKRCFTNPFSNDVLSGEFDLQYISYYPIDISSNVTIGTSTFRFYNTEIEETEMGSDTKRSTRDTTTASNVTTGNSQHYLMHMGLFKNVTSTITTTGTITMYGSVGVNSVYSGALINGILTGTLDTASGKNIKLGYYDSGDRYPLEISDNTKYLFINKIGDKAVLNLNGLYINGDAYETSDGTTYASSLIGDAQGIGINLLFSDIKIDARNKLNVTITNHKYVTKKSIFSNATLLNKYDVDSTSVAIYNFSQAEDWGSSTATTKTDRNNGGKVTFGRELTDSVEYEDEENRYYENGDNGNYVHPITYPGAYSTSGAANSAYDFSSDYLPYVRYFTSDTTKIANPPAATYTLREIKVNVVPSDLQDGCGTYDHPYSITGAKQLVAVSEMLDPKDTDTPIMNIMLPTDKNDESHWCLTDATTHSCKLFTYNGTRYTSTETNTTWELTEVRKYLASAYYQIGQRLELGSSFRGIGAYNNSEYAFKGVIVGINDQITITNKTNVPFIKISNGSVVKDLKIIVNNNGTFGALGSNATTFGYSNSTNNLYYGGVIGEIMGGDNIIDNVSMTYSNSHFIKTQNSYLMCIGGYVGVVVNGGLIFRNMSASKFTSKNAFKVNKDGVSTATNWVLDNDDTASHSHLFINPYIGRVINGYAINETTTYSGNTGTYTLDNGTKNYQICNVKVDVTDASDATSEKLYYDTFNSKNRVNIPTGQSLFILSLITQSGAGTATAANGDYAYGVGYDGTTKYNLTSAAANVATHLAKYDKVGTITFAEKTASGSDYVVSTGDKYGDKTATPYIISHYTRAEGGSYPARMMTGKTEFMKLSTANGTYNLPKSFRGIGSICYGMAWQETDNPYQMHIYGFDGNGATINMNTIFNSYIFDKENYASTVYGKDTSNKAAPNINLGIGLFNVLEQKRYTNSTTYKLDEGYYVGKFTLSGEVTVNEYNDSGSKQGGDLTVGNNGNSRNRYAVGGLTAGILADGYVNLYDLDLNDLNLTGTTYVAGYIGRNNITEKDGASGAGASKIYVNGCDTTATVITGSNGCCGGIVGGSISGYPSIYVNTAELKSGDTHATGDDGYYKSTMELSISCDSDTGQSGIGGIIGTLRNGFGVVFWVNNVTVIGGGTTREFINNSTKPQGTFTQGAGGLFGFARKADSIIVTNCEISNLKVKAPLAGGLFGNIDFYDDKDTYGTSPVIKIANCKVTSDSSSDYSIEGVKGAGGITGQFTSSKAYDKKVVGYDNKTYSYDVDGCEISNYTISQTGTATELCGAGGLFGFARATRATDNSWSKMRTIVNTSVHDCVITADGSSTNHGMGAIIGCVPTKTTTGNAAKSIYIDDSGVKRNTSGVCGDVGAYNIACYNNSFSYKEGSGTSAKCGNFVGQSNGQNFKIVGFTRKNNKLGTTALTADYGGTVSNASYIIDADYKNVSTTDQHGTAMAVGFDNGTSVGEGAKTNYFPYVTVSPKVVAGDPNFLTGDGMSTINDATSGEKIPLAKLITNENTGTAAENRIAYKTVSDDDINLVKQMITWGEDTTSDHDIKLTTYDKEMGLPDGYDAKNGEDFPIIAINGAETGGYNNYINAYIHTLTNTTDDYSAVNAAKYRVDIYACQCINGVYQKVSGTPGFSLNNNRKFVMDDSAADSIAENDQISMIDISFFDPTDETKTAYHLYIPVLTKKLLKFDFDSTALQGTKYEQSEYLGKLPTGEGATTKLAAGFDSWQTIYVQFSYSRDEVNEFLKTGKGLMWNTSKSLYFKYNSKQSLALTTQFILLDNNHNADMEYYKTKAATDTVTKSNGFSEDIIKFSDFMASDDTTGFYPQDLNFIADKNVVYTADNTAGVYASCDENDQDMVAFAYDSEGNNKMFFKKRTNEANAYTLTIAESIKETYYLSMYAFKKDNPRAKQTEIMTATVNDAYGFTVTCPITFTGNVITCQKNSSHDTEIYLGTFLKQTISLSGVTSSRDIAASDSHVIQATITSELSFDGNDSGYFHENLEGEHIYQGFYLYLNRYDINGKPVSDCSIKGQPTYNYSRSQDGTLISSGTSLADENAPYIEIEPIDIVIPARSSNWKSTQVVQVSVDYGTNETGIISEFPARTDPMDTNSGIGFVAKTRLEFAESRVKYSNMVNVYDRNYQRYYRDRRATDGVLKLTAIDQSGNDGYDPYGEQSHNKSPLGVNGNYIRNGSEYDADLGDYEFIKVGMDYDVSNLSVEEVFDGSHDLNIKIELEQKVDDTSESAGYKYIPVNIDDSDGDNTGYLKDFVFYGREGQDDLELVTESDSSHCYYTYSMDLDPDTQDDWKIRYTDTGSMKSFDGNIGFYVKTNEELEKVTGYRYANYRLKMTASISDTSYSSVDWIVYTNAKINAQYVKATTQSP